MGFLGIFMLNNLIYCHAYRRQKCVWKKITSRQLMFSLMLAIGIVNEVNYLNSFKVGLGERALDCHSEELCMTILV